MSFIGKVLIFLNLILAILYAGVSAVLFTQRVDYKKQIQELEKERDTFVEFMNKKGYGNEGEVNSLAAALQLGGKTSKFTSIAGRLNTELKTAQAEAEIKIAKLAGESERKDSKLLDLEVRVKEEESKRRKAEEDVVEKEIERKKAQAAADNLASRIDELKTRKDEAEEKLGQAEAKYNDLYVRELELKNTVSRLQQNLTIADNGVKNLEGQLGEAERRIKLYQEKFGELTTVETSVEGPLIKGRVFGVKSDLDLIMINKGDADGVRAGMQFIIYRGDEYIGRVEINKVDPEYSFGRVVRQKLEIKQGDEVTTRLER